MRKIKFLLILIIFIIGINNVSAFDTSLKVYDYAQVLTPSEEETLKNNIDNYIRNYDMDMALVTVKYHTKKDTMNYADDFYDYNGFGIGTNNDGVIFVIDFTFGYTDIWMSTTGKAINFYTDSRIDNILDKVALNKNNGYYAMLDAFIKESSYYASLGIPTINTNNNNTINKNRRFNFTKITIISFVISSLIVLFLALKNKMVKAATTASEYLNKDSIKITLRNDVFLTTHTSSVRINNSSSSGGSSTHRSSSGRSHGGGGRRL